MTIVHIVSSVSDIWTGADGTQPTWWDIATTVNWTGNALINTPAGSYADGDTVLFDDTAAPVSPVEVAIQTNLAPGNMLFANSTKNYIVTNSGAFGIGGSGTLTLGTSSSYSGTTTISSTGATGSPTLTGAHPNALGSTNAGTIVLGSATINNGSQINLADTITVTDETLTLDAGAVGLRATLVTSGTATWDGNVVVTGVNTQQIAFIANGASANLTVGASAADTVTGSRSFTIRGTGIGTINSSIQIGTSGVNKADSGRWTLASANTYGNTTVGGGTLAIAVASLATNSTVSVSGSGVLQLNFAVTNRVAALVLNGVNKAPGVYNNVSGGPFITGTGSLQVGSPGPTLTSVSPNPATGSSYPVTLGLTGSGFTGASAVWLTNLTIASGATCPRINNTTYVANKTVSKALGFFRDVFGHRRTS